MEKQHLLGGPEVVILGDVNVDLIAHYPQFPVPSQDALASSIEAHCGGSAANTAAALSQLGIRARLIGRVGRDPMGHYALGCLKNAGVRVEGIQRDPIHTTGLIYVIVTPDGERTMLSERGANAHTGPGGLRKSLFRSASLLHLSGYALLAEPQRAAALRALGIALEYHVPVSLDPGLLLCRLRPAELLELLPALDILLPTLDEASALTGQSLPESCAQALEAHGARALVMKLGEAGCLLAAGGETARLPAFSVQPRDATGAGDAFDAGLIVGHLAGLGWTSAALLANACGAVAVSRVGAADRAPDAGEVSALLAANLDDPAFSQYRSGMEQAIGHLSTLPPSGSRGSAHSIRLPL